MNYTAKKIHDFAYMVTLEDGRQIQMHVVAEKSELNEMVENFVNESSPQNYTKSLEEKIQDALEVVKSRHALVLSDLSGNASVEERDTWPLQKEWATAYIEKQSDHHKNLLLGLMTEGELAVLGANSAQVMAEKIMAKSQAMDLLTSKAGGLKRVAEEALKFIKEEQEVDVIMNSLEQQMIQAIAEFKASLDGG